MKYQKGFTLVELFWIIIFGFGVVGWVINIYKIVNLVIPFTQWGVVEVLRVVGIVFPPLGAILGYC